MFRIGQFSKISNCSIRALHHYEEQGLLTPAYIDPKTKYRYYSAKQLNETNIIKTLQQTGMSLSTIKDLTQGTNPTLLQTYYDTRKEELEHEISQLMEKKQLLENLSSNLKEGTRIDQYHVTMKQVPKRKVMSIRTKIDSYEDEYLLWNKLYKESQKQNIQFVHPMFGMTLYHDKEFVETNIDIEVQSNIVGEYHNEKDIRYYEAPNFIMAAVTFSGDFSQMPDVTNTLATWIESSSYEMTGIMVNIPIVSPAMDKNPANWVTEAGFIIEK